ncbi:hypothetical protein CLIB1423_39S00122 [[Candida] railenensis]|uniref:Uncharacterized protein n=1 Tax=[Candida] railenensis TaxID=45579 RepID=A0A9P0QUL1_9ASCO|nr:hypothetical protein CLIB1423_39S00122 [[Candida] railenensis]
MVPSRPQELPFPLIFYYRVGITSREFLRTNFATIPTYNHLQPESCMLNFTNNNIRAKKTKCNKSNDHQGGAIEKLDHFQRLWKSYQPLPNVNEHTTALQQTTASYPAPVASEPSLSPILTLSESSSHVPNNRLTSDE